MLESLLAEFIVLCILFIQFLLSFGLKIVLVLDLEPLVYLFQLCLYLLCLLLKLTWMHEVVAVVESFDVIQFFLTH